MNKRFLTIVTGSALLLLTAVSCSKDERTLKSNIKDLASKSEAFNKRAGELEESIKVLTDAEGRIDSILASQLDKSISGIIEGIASESVRDRVSKLNTEASGISSAAASRANDIATAAAKKAQAEWIHSDSIAKIEEEIKQIEQKARAAVRGNDVSAVKSELKGYVDSENELVKEYTRIVKDDIKAIEDNKAAVSSKYVAAGDRDEIIAGRMSARISEVVAKTLQDGETVLVNQIVSSISDSVKSEKKAEMVDFSASLRLAVDKRVVTLAEKRKLLEDKVNAYKGMSAKLEDTLSKIRGSSDKDENVKAFANIDAEYKNMVADFAQHDTESRNMLIRDADTFIVNEAMRLISASVASSVSESVASAIDSKVNEARAAGLSSDDQSSVALDVSKDLNVAILSLMDTSVSSLRTMLSDLEATVKNLQGFRDNIAKRVPIVKKDFDSTEMVSLQAGEVADIYGTKFPVKAFMLGKYEVTYALWYEVYQWATAHGYSFAGKGYEGSDFDTLGIEPTARGKYQPVTGVSATDALLWMNAYSEKTGKTPVYTITVTIAEERDSEGNIVREASSEVVPVRETGFSVGAVAVNTNADGYRLPTQNELVYAGAFVPNKKKSLDGNSAYAWTWYNSDTGTHTVGTKKAVRTKDNPTVEIYDLHGNAAEWASRGDGVAEADASNGSWSRASTNGVYPYSYFHGFMKSAYAQNTNGLRVAQYVK